MAEYIVDMYCAQSGVKCERVVRCKDCKYFTETRWEVNCYLMGDHHEEISREHFCAWGKPKEA